MDYKLIITERAEELMNQCVSHIIFQLKNEQAAMHLLEEINKIYDRMEQNPYQFADCRDEFLKSRGNKEAIIADMNYIIIFRIDGDIVYILGIFHQLENYKEKL